MPVQCEAPCSAPSARRSVLGAAAGMNPVGSPLSAGTAPASGSAGAAQRASPSSPSNVAPSSSRPHAAGREEVSSSSLDRVLIHPLQPPGALSLILISSGMGAQPGLWESLRQRRPAWHPQGHSAEAKSTSRGPVAGGCGNSISGGGNCKGLKAGEAVSPKTVRKKQNPTPKNNRQIQKTEVSSEAGCNVG